MTYDEKWFLFFSKKTSNVRRKDNTISCCYAGLKSNIILIRKKSYNYSLDLRLFTRDKDNIKYTILSSIISNSKIVCKELLSYLYRVYLYLVTKPPGLRRLWT